MVSPLRYFPNFNGNLANKWDKYLNRKNPVSVVEKERMAGYLNACEVEEATHQENYLGAFSENLLYVIIKFV